MTRSQELHSTYFLYTRHMPVSVDEVFSHAGLRPAGCVRWGERVPEDRPGVYVISTTSNVQAAKSGIAKLPFAAKSYEDLIARRPDVLVDREPATALTFESRLQRFWLADEPVLYIGLAGTSLSQRVNNYYTTAIGMRSPHSGGWWLKTFDDLPSLFVHYAPTDHVEAAERAMIHGFAERVPNELTIGLYDPQRVAPFANVKVPGLGNKRHGFQNHKLMNGKRPASSVRASDADSHIEQPATLPAAPVIAIPSGRSRRVPSQPITKKDRERSSLRIPAGSKHFFPPEPCMLLVTLHSQFRTVSWNPKGTRSGLLGLGVATMRELGTTGEPVYIESDEARYRIIE